MMTSSNQDKGLEDEEEEDITVSLLRRFFHALTTMKQAVAVLRGEVVGSGSGGLKAPSSGNPSESFVLEKAAGVNDLFDLPKEMQMEILGYLDRTELGVTRLVCRSWNDKILANFEFVYKKAVLSNETEKFVLPFDQKISRIQVENLTGVVRVLTKIKPDGVIKTVDELIFGDNVERAVMQKLLKTADAGEDAKVMGLAPFNRGVAQFLLEIKKPCLFNGVTKFELDIVSRPFEELKGEELVLRKLSLWRKFPNLVEFKARINPGGALLDFETIELYHSIYMSVHNFLFSHRATVQKIEWDFSDLLVIGTHALADAHQYPTTKSKMMQITLKSMDVKVCDMEGTAFWDLTAYLLQRQHSLTNLRIRASRAHTSAVFRHVSSSYMIAADAVMHNRHTLTDLHIANRPFSFYSILYCKNLKRMTVAGASYLSVGLLHANAGDEPFLIEEINLDYRYLYPNDIERLSVWLATLPELKTLSLKGFSYRTTMLGQPEDMFPTAEDIEALCRPPKLTTLCLNFDASSWFKVIQLKEILDRLNPMVNNTKGMKKKGYMSDCGVYVVEFHLQRSIFKGINTN